MSWESTASEDRALVHRVIYEELCLGRIDPASQAAYLDIIARLANRGAEAVILGCTEITLLILAAESPLPVFDTTALHAAAAVDFILGPARTPVGVMSISDSPGRLSVSAATTRQRRREP